MTLFENIRISLSQNTLIAAIAFAVAGVMSSLAQNEPSLLEIESGIATFQASTNMPGVEVKGKSGAMVAQVELSRDSTRLILQRVTASVPVKSLATGMKVRDEHMRRSIFTTPDGQEPDLQFKAETGTCTASGSGHEFTCPLAGNLTIRGVARPLNITLHVKEQGSAGSLHAAGDGMVKLSDYAIEPPSQFGAKPSNDVKFHLEFTGRQKSAQIANVGLLQ